MNKEWLLWKIEFMSYTPKVHRVIVDANPYRSRICVHRSERFSSFPTKHSLLILELPQESISFIESFTP